MGPKSNVWGSVQREEDAERKREEGSVTIKVEIGVMNLQNKKCQQLLAITRY